MTHQAPSTMQAWPTSMNVFLTTTFSVPFAQFGDTDEANSGCIKYLWFFYEWTSPQTHPEKKRSLLFTQNLGAILLQCRNNSFCRRKRSQWYHRMNPPYLHSMATAAWHSTCKVCLPRSVATPPRYQFLPRSFHHLQRLGSRNKMQRSGECNDGHPRRGFFRQSYTTVQTEKLLVISTPTVHIRCSTLIVCKPNFWAHESQHWKFMIPSCLWTSAPDNQQCCVIKHLHPTLSLDNKIKKNTFTLWKTTTFLPHKNTHKQCPPEV